MRFILLTTAAVGYLCLAGCGSQNQASTGNKAGTISTSAAATKMADDNTNSLLGLPPVPIPANNPMSDAKTALGKKLFLDERFSADGKVSCATCHKLEKAFTDGPLQTSLGFMDKTGTRNAPTVINSAYNKTQFWDGRRPDLESQSMDPPTNPVEGGLHNHEPILEIVRTDPDYKQAFSAVFNKRGNAVTMTEVSRAIAAFERTIISGNSPFDRYYFGGQKEAMSEAAVRGFEVFQGQGRCVSCHTIEQDYALFTDHKFHNLGIGFDKIEHNLKGTASKLIAFKRDGLSVEDVVLTNKDVSELGRFALNGEWQDIGQFKTPTLRNIAATGPYMHDGSLTTLKDVVTFYNDTVVPGNNKEPNPFQSGGIRPLNLSETQQADLVVFLESLTSPEYANAVD